MIRQRIAGLLAGFALVLGLATAPAIAQSSSGNIAGTAVAGETIVVNGEDNGFHREIKIKKDGKFTIRRVPTGHYTVVQKHADGSAEAPKAIQIHAGVTVRVQ